MRDPRSAAVVIHDQALAAAERQRIDAFYGRQGDPATPPGTALDFTHEDVRRLRDMDRHDADVQFLQEIAGRIAALLPPETAAHCPPHVSLRSL